MNIDRRDFINKGTKLALGASALSFVPIGSFATGKPARKLKIVLVGTGIRGTTTWGEELFHPYKEYLELVALCDINQKRAEFAKGFIGIDVPVYRAADFERMVRETKPDAVIVTTTDCFHEEYVVKSMELGCDVFCEKPLVTEALQGENLLVAEIRTGKKIITTFNARHHTYSEEIKKVLMSGTLGKIISAEFQEYLDVDHGASYYRRWHGKSSFSGTLLCHKASHHFDQMNWFLEAEPVEVKAFGEVAFYGKNNVFRSKNCRGCPFSDKCEFYWDITKDKMLTGMYVDCEDEDGYLRDGCVWDNDIDSYDTMTVQVRYNSGALLSYSLNTFLPYEGQRIAFNGQKGRLDVRVYERQPWNPGHGSDFRLTHNFKETNEWHVETLEGKYEGINKEFIHGGADKTLKDMLFLPEQKDPLGKMADSRAGVMASLVGIAARQSIETGKTIRIADLIDFPNEWEFGS